MVLYTVDNKFFRRDVIDAFDSAIWTERYYGDGDFELDVPITDQNLTNLPKGQILLCEGSIQPMIIETRDGQNGSMKLTGITLLQWLNNRIIRTTNDHSVRDWLITATIPGDVLKQIVQSFCMYYSPYLDGTIDIGIPSAQTALFPVPGLSIGVTDRSDAASDFSVPFGPVYDALRPIATTYDIGMSLNFDAAYDDYFQLSFNSFKGIDRTSDQTVNPTIRFSPEMDTFANIRDLESISDYKNYNYTFAPNAPAAVRGNAGSKIDPAYNTNSFLLRVGMNYVEDIQSDFSGTAGELLTALNQKAAFDAFNHQAVQLVDGEIVQTGQLQYGVDYFLGDYIEVEGNFGELQKSRITEYIRSQDSTGERAYPGLASS